MASSDLPQQQGTDAAKDRPGSAADGNRTNLATPCPQRAANNGLILAIGLDDARIQRLDGRIALTGAVTVPRDCPDVPGVGALVHVVYRHHGTGGGLRAQASPHLWRVIAARQDANGDWRLQIVVTGERAV